MMNKQWHPDDLQKAFPQIPERCSRALMDIAGSLKEVDDMKMRYTPQHTLRLVLALVLVSICVMGVAAAGFYPQISEVFGRHYGADTQSWLEQGDIALPADTVQASDVTLTLNEVVYKNHGLYGLGTIVPGDGVVLLCPDCDPGDAYGYAVHQGDAAPEGSPSIRDKATQIGGSIRQVDVQLNRISVDGGAMIVPDSVGYAMTPQRDGSVQFLFEVEDGQAISKGETYTLSMTTIVRNVSSEGIADEASAIRQDWTVTIQPEPFSEMLGTSATATAAPAATEAPANSTADMQIVVPEAYTLNGTLPVYQAKERDFSESLDYAWFNQSGVAAETRDPRHIGGSVDFNDGGHLDWGSYYFFYDTYDGTYEATGELEDGSTFTENLKKLTMASQVRDIASWMVFGFPGTGDVYTLERTQLTHISLDQAKAAAETLMQQLGMTGYTCTTALDMSAERICQMGSLLNEQIDKGNLYTNGYRYDYTTVTTADEGYLLSYHKYGTDGDIAGQFEAVFYVTADGIKSINLRDAYVQGDVVRTPATLVDVQSVVDALPAAIADSRYPEAVTRITRATLTWMPASAGKGDDLIMTPVWTLSYQTAESQQQGYECWATFDAIDGKLRDAIFN